MVFPYRLRKLSAKIAEECERFHAAPLLAHEEHRCLRQEQIDGGNRARNRRGRECSNALAAGAVADLIMILNEGDKGRGGQLCAWLAARAALILGQFALKREALCERAAQAISERHG